MANTYPAALSRNTRNSLIYADAISAVWSWWDLISDPSYALREDLDIWEVCQRDPQVYQGIQQRLNAIAGREWRVMPAGNSKRPASKIKASIMDAMLRRIPHFQDARRKLAEAVFRGQSTALICGRREFISLAEQPSMHWFVSTGLRHIDPRRFVIKPERERRQDGSQRIKGKLYMSVIPTYQSLPTGGGSKPGQASLWQGRYVPVTHPEWFLRSVYDDDEARLGFGRGILDAMYFTMWCKQIVLREGLQGLERFVHGVPIVTLDPSKRGDTGQTSEAMRDAALAKIKVMRAGHAFALNTGETLQWAEPGGVGNQMVMGLLEYLDRRLMGLITGASLKSGGNASDTGSYASDAIGMEMSDAIVQYDRDKFDEDLTLDLIGLLNRVNRPQFEALGKLINCPGLADEAPGVFTTVIKRKIDPLTVLQLVQGAQQVKGFDILRSEVYDQTGFSMPSDDEDDIFEGGAAIQEQPAVGPDGMPLPEGMPEPGQEDEEAAAAEEEAYPDGLPEDQDQLFGGGAPEDDGGLFGEPDEAQIYNGGGGEPEEVQGEADFRPELELLGEEEPATNEPKTDAAPVEPVETEVSGKPEEQQEKTIEAPKVTPNTPGITVKVNAGGPSESIEIEGMEKQRKAARE